MAFVIVRASLDLPWTQGQHWLGAIQSLYLAFFIDAEDHGAIRRIQVQTHDVAHLSMSSGSGESLKLSLRWGCSPKARQIRLIVIRPSPVAFASSRVLQCVCPRGVLSSVRITTSST